MYRFIYFLEKLYITGNIRVRGSASIDLKLSHGPEISAY